jgi:D-serine deaminase-like pyridoxal phosphate-dependent protein
MRDRQRLASETTAALDTPALLVDLDIMAGNIERIARTCRDHGVGWRPHTKGQKTPEIIRLELAAGAIGITCAKVGEAEVMVGAGIGDILIANEIVGEIKMRRLMELLARADITVCVDNPRNIAELGAAAAGRGKRLGIVAEVDIGMHRASSSPRPPPPIPASPSAASWAGKARLSPSPIPKPRRKPSPRRWGN